MIPDLGGAHAEVGLLRQADAERARQKWLHGTDERGAVKPQTVNRLTAVASGFFKWAIARGYALENPFARYLSRDERFAEVRADPPPLSEKDLGRFLAAIPNAVLRRAATVEVDTGISPSELRRVRWRDVREDARVVRIVSSYERGLPKGKARERVVPLSPRAWAAMAEQREAAGDDLFAGMPKNYRRALAAARVNADRARAKALRRALEPSERMPRFRWYDLRHYALTRVTAAGLGWRELQDLAGWTTPAQATRYVHPSLERIREAVDRLGTTQRRRGRRAGSPAIASTAGSVELGAPPAAGPPLEEARIECAPRVSDPGLEVAISGPDRDPWARGS